MDEGQRESTEEDFAEMESRLGGGGAGAIVWGFFVLIALVVGAAWCFWT